MKEIYVLAEISQSMFYRTSAVFDNPAFGIRFFNDISLAKKALILNDKPLPKEVLKKTEKEVLLYGLMKKERYFSSANYSDCQNLEKSLSVLLNLGTNDDETMKAFNSVAEFVDKNSAIFNIYKKYCDELKRENCYDDNHIINEVIDLKLSLDNNEREFVCLKEFPLTNKQLELLKTVSKGNFKEISILDLFNKKEVKQANYKFAKCYGTQNEVLHIFKQIRDEHLNIDDCLIVDCGQATQHLFDFSLLHDLPVKFANGLPSSFGNGYKLYRNITNHKNAGNCGMESLKKVLLDSSFDIKKLKDNIGLDTDLKNILKIAGYLHIKFEKDDIEKADNLKIPNAFLKPGNIFGYCDKDIESAENLVKELSKGISYIITNYTVIRDNEKEKAQDIESIELINKYLKLIDKGINEEEINLLIDSSAICKDANGDEALLVTSLNKALYSLRHHIFIIGVSANNIPKGPKENYLLLDNDFAKFKNKGNGYIGDSIAEVERRKQNFNDLLRVASSLGCDIRLSYSDYDYVELKDVNPSSLLYDAGYDDEKAEAIGYFDSGFSRNDNFGKAYLKRTNIKINQRIINNESISKNLLKRSYSPSQISCFFDCPKHFYLKFVLNLDDSFEDDPNQTIPANDYGTLVHDCMNYLSQNKDATKEEFLEYSKQQIDDYFTYRIPSNTQETETKKKTFIKDVTCGYENDPHNEVVTAEEDHNATYIYDNKTLNLHGFPDRVEKDENGKGIIVDYKTYRDIKNKENDIDTCLQVMIYGYIMKEKGINIDHCEYRYLSNPMVIKCDYKLIEGELKGKLNTFIDALSNKKFPIVEDKNKQEEVCKYCKFADFCGKETKEEDNNE